MTNRNNDNDQTYVQQLVSGQLTHQQRSQWLTSLPHDSPAWRQLALGFIENQIFNEAISDMKPPTFAPESGNHGFVAADQGRSETSVVGGSFSEPRGARKTTMAWLAIAASLAVGALVGWMANSSSGSNANQQVLITGGNGPSAAESSEMTVTNTELRDDKLQLQLADALSRSVQPFSANARRTFLKAGYLVDESRTMAKVELPTGSSVELPVRQVTVQYLGQSAYQ